jgi:hypothetical protein
MSNTSPTRTEHLLTFARTEQHLAAHCAHFAREHTMTARQRVVYQEMAAKHAEDARSFAEAAYK